MDYAITIVNDSGQLSNMKQLAMRLLSPVSRMLAHRGQSSTSLVRISMIAAGTLCALNLYLVMSISTLEIRTSFML
jgi:hypothetical protein